MAPGLAAGLISDDGKTIRTAACITVSPDYWLRTKTKFTTTKLSGWF
jgi:hypothetical protein